MTLNAGDAAIADADLRAVFEALPGNYIVIAADAPRFTMLAASDGALATALSTRDQLVGRPLFDVFSDANPENPEPSGVTNLRASLETVLRTRAPHRMPVQRYDFRRPDGGWEVRHWAPHNVPVLAPDGTVRCILHHVEDATSRVRDREATSAAERREAELRTVLESMSDAVYIGNMSGIILANQAALEQLGFSSRAELNRHIATLVEELQTRDAETGAPIPPEQQAFARAMRGERVIQDVRVRHRLTGEDRVVRCAAAPVVVDGRVIAAVAVNTDVTERRAAEAALRQSEERYRLIVEGARDYAIITTDPDARITSWSPGAHAVYGWPADEIIGQPLAVTFTPEDRAAGEPENELAQARTEGVAPNVRWHLRRDGGRVFIDGTSRALRDADGRLRGFLKIGQDTTERRRLDMAIRASEARQAFLVRLGDAMRSLGDPGEIQATACRLLTQHLDVNRVAYTEVEGETGAEERVVRGVHLRQGPTLVERIPVERFGEPVLRLLREGVVAVVNDVATDPRITDAARATFGEASVASFVSVPLLNRGRWVAAFNVHDVVPRAWSPEEVALVQEVAERTWDAAERARAESALRASEVRHRALVENLRDYLICLLDARGRVAEWPSGAERLTGYAAADVLGRHLAFLYTPEDVAAGEVDEELAEAAREGRAEREGWRVRKDETLFWVDEIVTAIRDGEGRLAGFAKISRDLTERLRAAEAAERVRLEAERDAVRGLLAAAEERERLRLGLELHDVLGQSLTLLSLETKSLEPYVRGRDGAERLARVRALVASTSVHAHGIAQSLRPAGLGQLTLGDALSAYAHEWQKRMGIPVDVHAEGPGVDASLAPEAEAALYRIAQEALTNVAKHAGASRVSVTLSRADGHVRLVVEDDGHGFDVAAALARAGSQRRLGLAGMRERAALAGGALDVESSPGSGTTVVAGVPISVAPERFATRQPES
ncbi:MAG: PAS domain S-box protein [Gemmatimonadaceae bacterium]